MLAVKEVFATVQGEGSQAGTPSVFVRLAGCNLWSGKEEGRASGRGVCAAWCDTDFVGGERVEPSELVKRVGEASLEWRLPHVTITGGEPGLQLRKEAGQQFVEQLLGRGIRVAVETNGTVDCEVFRLRGVHVTLSPKRLQGNTLGKSVARDLGHLKLWQCNDLKVVVPQWTAQQVEALVRVIDYDGLYFQPLDQGSPLENARQCIALAQRWGGQLSLQTHKLLGIP